MKVDFKIAAAILAFVATMAGFYYTTQLRLDRLEETITERSNGQDVGKLRKQIRQLTKRVLKLETQADRR